MKSNIMKKGTILLLGAVMFAGFSYSLHAEDGPRDSGTFVEVDESGNISYRTPKSKDISDELKAQYDSTNSYEVVSSIGNSKQVIGTFDTYEEAKKAKDIQSRSRSVGDVSIEGNGLLRDIQYGVVDFKTKSVYNTTKYYQNANRSGDEGYLNGNSVADGAYLGTNSDGSMVKFRLSGVTAWVSINDVVIRDIKNAYTSYYKVISNGNLCHFVSYEADATKKADYSGGIYVGKAPSYLSQGVNYYSYDGINFYTSYASMIEDYKAGTSSRAVNASSPYYNYFQYLPFRAKTNFTAAQLNKLVEVETNNNTKSKLWNTGASFIKHQNTYGVNAAMMLGGGAVESAWGTSEYAVNRNNLFGHNAVDSNPDLATEYPSIDAAIEAHAKAYLSTGYLNPKDWRYYGPHFGNKNGGMNFKYASDPNLGEKYASIVHDIEWDNGKQNIDYGKESIGLVKEASVNIRKEPSTDASSPSLYQTSVWGNHPVLIIGKVKGQSINGNTTWYKIQSDGILTADRKAVQGTGTYNYDRDYAYISAAYVDVIYDGKNIAGGGTTPEPEPEPDPDPVYKTGDVNGDGYVSSKDFNAVMNHIMKTPELIGEPLKRADVNGDGYISSKDYNAIKNIIMGVK